MRCLWHWRRKKSFQSGLLPGQCRMYAKAAIRVGGRTCAVTEYAQFIVDGNETFRGRIMIWELDVARRAETAFPAMRVHRVIVGMGSSIGGDRWLR